MGKEKSFEESTFAIAWTGESPDSQILQGFKAVCKSIADDTGLSVDEVRQSLSDPDDWNLTPDGGEDKRHIYYRSEYVYCCCLTIVRILR